MKRRFEIQVWAYCGGTPETVEHVIARQFFSREARQRGDLPRVPACGLCNQEKQPHEDFMLKAGFSPQLTPRAVTSP